VLLSISEACRILGINPQTLRRWENAGKVKCVWTEGGQRRVAVEEVARILGCPPEDLEVKRRERAP
jgi:putative resolvase